MDTNANITRPEVRLTTANVTAYLEYKLSETPSDQTDWIGIYDELADALTERAERQKARRLGVPYRDLMFATDYALTMSEEERVDDLAHRLASKY